MLFAIVLYVLLHDISSLYIFNIFSRMQNFSDSTILKYYQKIQKSFISAFEHIQFWKLLRNYSIDVLWFVSFCLLVTGIFELEADNNLKTRVIKYSLCILMALLSEFLQLVNPMFGTFDFIDLSLYFVIISIFALGETLQQENKTNS